MRAECFFRLFGNSFTCETTARVKVGFHKD
jgi:hypothetical protein